jgi:hypothetical protein
MASNELKSLARQVQRHAQTFEDDPRQTFTREQLEVARQVDSRVVTRHGGLHDWYFVQIGKVDKYAKVERQLSSWVIAAECESA